MTEDGYLCAKKGLAVCVLHHPSDDGHAPALDGALFYVSLKRVFALVEEGGSFGDRRGHRSVERGSNLTVAQDSAVVDGVLHGVLVVA